MRSRALFSLADEAVDILLVSEEDKQVQNLIIVADLVEGMLVILSHPYNNSFTKTSVFLFPSNWGYGSEIEIGEN